MPPSFPNAPIRTSIRTVPPEWIDYNGHMNVAYYVMAIDKALDEVFDQLGLGHALVKSHNMGPMALQAQVHYLDELLEGQRFAGDFQLLDADQKRMHVFMSLLHLDKGTVAATYEGMSINVDLEARKSAPYPDEFIPGIEALRAAHADLPRPPQVGATIAIRRKG